MCRAPKLILLAGRLSAKSGTAEFHPGYGFDLQKMLDQWPLKELKKQELKQQLISALQAGDKVQATLALLGEKKTVDLLANPRFKQVNALQDDGQKLTAGQA